jgi:hypothetical protein
MITANAIPKTLQPADDFAPVGAGRHIRHDDLMDSLTVALDVIAESASMALRRVDLAAPLTGALLALDVGDRIALLPTRLGPAHGRPLRLGLIWRIDGSRPAESIRARDFESFDSPGHVKASWTIAVTPSNTHALLSTASFFSATDDGSRARLLDGWSVVGAVARALAHRTARAVRDCAEALDDELAVEPWRRRAA